MTSTEAITVTLMPTLNNISMSAAITLKAAIQNDLSKSWRFSREISAVEFRYNETTVFGIHNDFTYDSEIYHIVKLYCLLILVSSQFKLYIILMNLINVNHLIYWILINFSDIFHYFCEEKTPKLKSLIFIQLITGTN